MEYFAGKTVIDGKEQKVVLDAKQARVIYQYLVKNNYIDENEAITGEYHDALENNRLAPLPESLKNIAAGVQCLIQSVFDENVLKNMVSNGNTTKVIENELNDNFYKKEFQTLWHYINHKYAYTVDFKSSELVRKAVAHINEKMQVASLQYTVVSASQRKELDQETIAQGQSFEDKKTKTKDLKAAGIGQVKYDLIGKVAAGTTLTRRTAAEILYGITAEKFAMFRDNPEEFISKAILLIDEEKATMIVEHITYNSTDMGYDSTIFTAEKHSQNISQAFKGKKHIQDYVFTDGTAEKSIERRFAEDLDSAEEVCVYAKLPKGFAIPTPVGHYSPDWAIAFYEGTVKHIYFIAETKGTMESLQLRPIEKAKIDCAKKLFNEISTSKVRYHDVDSYQSLLNIMGQLK
ncbi:MAG: type III restriction endonuclease subunit R [Veillonellales bacterium]